MYLQVHLHGILYWDRLYITSRINKNGIQIITQQFESIEFYNNEISFRNKICVIIIYYLIFTLYGIESILSALLFNSCTNAV